MEEIKVKGAGSRDRFKFFLTKMSFSGSTLEPLLVFGFLRYFFDALLQSFSQRLLEK
jgi:hypothetical protein